MASTGPRLITAVVLAVFAALAGLVLALIVTPPVTVTVFGQDLRLGAVSPLEIRSVSGPGQADLFGEGAVQTALEFDGPIRPRIVWQRFNRNEAAADFIQTSDVNGPSFRTDLLGSALASGWTEYFLRLIAMSAVLAGAVRLALLGAARVLRGSLLRPASRREGVLSVVGAMVLGALATGAAAGVTMASARDQLASVRTLADITGTAPVVPTPDPVGPARGDIELAVIGDSTAAGVGNDPLTDPAGYDETCGRSQDAYAVVLGSALRVPMLNLACSSATLEAGLLGPQVEGDVTIPPQVGVLKSITSLRAVVVSVGANDIGWADFLRLCYGLERCDDQASERLFESRLDNFRIRYVQLLQQLSDLPGHPAVFVVLYYDPFGDTFDCPALRDPNAPAQPPLGYGFAADPGVDNQAEKIRTKIDPLRSELTQMNTVLEEGATAFGYAAVSPSFAGHTLCTAQPWVQGMSERYPFHPNSAGELAIAAALLPSLAGVATTPG